MSTDRKTIFLVDDDVTNLAVGGDTLDEYYDVLTFNSGEWLLKALERITPDLILLDIEMPEMNGYEVIKILKNNAGTAHVPVIFLTAKSDSGSELEGLSLGAIDYIIKPFSPPLLLKRIEVHLLVETQKQELIHFNNKLIHFNNNLQAMVDAKTKTVVELQNAVLKTMAELVEFRDNVTGGHIERTQKHLRILLEALLEQGIYKDETTSWNLELVWQSAQLHDVGKIAIRDSILKKPDKLTKEEFDEVKTHPVFGARVIGKIGENTTDKTFLEYAKVFALTHHEKWDGSGYPNGLNEEAIPLLGRIMAIVDVYDALVSERPYKKALTHGEAVKIIEDSSGIHFDPALVEVFLDIADKHEKSAILYHSTDPVK